MADVFTPYSTAVSLTKTRPTWAPASEQERIQAYLLYDQIYWTSPETFKLTLRGTESNPLYIPSGRIIVNTMNRYTAKGMDFIYTGNGAEQAKLVFDTLFKRERFMSKFLSAKKIGMIKGDWLFHIVGNPEAEEGKTLSIYCPDPATYFPVFDSFDLDKIIKVHLAEQFFDDEGNTKLRRQTYEYAENGNVISSLTIWEPDKDWFAQSTNEGLVQTVIPPTELAGITQIPVYHIRNNFEEGNPFGSSEMRGHERLMAGINQAMTDEDVTLALDGLGVYATEGGAPIDDDGNETPWIIGPGRVVEDASGSFKRINASSSVQPYQDHVSSIYNFMLQAADTPAIAVGKVDVQVAESGISLQLQMSPILARSEENQTVIADVLNQMMYDLHTMWLPVYERISFSEDLVITAKFANPLPVNRKSELEDVLSLVMAGIMSKTTARERLTEIGYRFDEQELTRLVEEQSLSNELTASADPFAARLDAQLAAGTAS